MMSDERALLKLSKQVIRSFLAWRTARARLIARLGHSRTEWSKADSEYQAALAELHQFVASAETSRRIEARKLFQKVGA